MTIHVVRKNGFKYTFYDDKTYNLYISGEAYFDEGQTLRKRKGRGNICNRVKVEPDDRPIVVQKQPIVIQQPPEYHPIRDAVRESLADSIKDVVYMGIDKLVYEGLPYLWHKKIKPGIDDFKEYKKNGKKLFIEQVMEDSATQEPPLNTQIVEKTKSERKANNIVITEENHEEWERFLFHYLSSLNSLSKLDNASEIDIECLIKQLSNPATLKKFNTFLSANPNLLEITQSNQLVILLGRDLFQGGVFVPIEENEIIKLATVNNQEDM